MLTPSANTKQAKPALDRKQICCMSAVLRTFPLISRPFVPELGVEENGYYHWKEHPRISRKPLNSRPNLHIGSIGSRLKNMRSRETGTWGVTHLYFSHQKTNYVFRNHIFIYIICQHDKIHRLIYDSMILNIFDLYDIYIFDP